MTESAGWPGEMVAEMGLPPRPDIAGDDWVEVWRDRLERTPQWPIEKLRHPRRDAYWKHGSWCEDWAAITCPVLAIGGWIDTYQDACLQLLEHAPTPSRAIIGPWAHTRPHVAWPGPAFDHRELMCRWFDRFLNDVDNGIDREPRLLAYLRDGVAPEPYPDVAPGRWRAFTSWPSAAPPTVLHLAGERSSDAAPRELAGAHVERAAVGRPRARRGGAPAGRRSGSRPTWRPTTATRCASTSAPLEQPLEILGVPVLELEVSADRPVALVAARLEHVHPDGFSALVCRGGLNLTHRDSHEEPTPLEPGAPVPGAGAAGVDRHGDPGRPHAAAGAGRRPLADHVAVARAGQRSRCTAGAWCCRRPTRRRGGGAGAARPVTERAPNPVRSLDGPAEAWTQTRDHGARTHREPLHRTAGRRSGRAAGRTARGDTRCLIADDDPASCRVVTENVAECEHPGVHARCEGRLEQWCDRDRDPPRDQPARVPRRRAVLRADVARVVPARPV